MTLKNSDEIRGLHGLPLVENHFIMCSNGYCDLFADLGGRIPASFIDAVRQKIKFGIFLLQGDIVWRKLKDDHGFLVIQILDDDAIPVQQDIDHLTELFGVEVACYADLVVDGLPALAYLTAFVPSVDQLPIVTTISRAFSEFGDKWRTQDATATEVADEADCQDDRTRRIAAEAQVQELKQQLADAQRQLGKEKTLQEDGERFRHLMFWHVDCHKNGKDDDAVMLTFGPFESNKLRVSVDADIVAKETGKSS